MSSRRTFAHEAARGVAAAWLTASWADVAAAFAQPTGVFQVLSPAEARDLEAMASQIIPTDDTPGAREAGVIHFMDKALATFAADQLPLVRQGLTRLRGRIARRWRGGVTFATLRGADQIAILKRLERDDAPFFEVVRTATVMGMFANPARGGNRGKIGWRLLGFEDRFVWQPPFGDYDQLRPTGGR